MKQAILGNTGIKTSLLAIGTGSSGGGNASNQSRLGQEKFTALIRHAYDRGIRFFDSAEMYGTQSLLGQAIKGMPRDEIYIDTKTFTRDPKRVREQLDSFRKELGVDYIDSMLMHCVTESDWPARLRPVMDVLSEARERGIIRATGCSFHSLVALEASVNEPWGDVHMVRINPWGREMDNHPGQPHESAPALVKPLVQQLHANGKGVIGMKLAGLGTEMTETDRLQRIRASIRFALCTGAVDVLNIGFETPTQIDEVITELNAVLQDIDG